MMFGNLGVVEIFVESVGILAQILNLTTGLHWDCRGMWNKVGSESPCSISSPPSWISIARRLIKVTARHKMALERLLLYFHILLQHFFFFMCWHYWRSQELQAHWNSKSHGPRACPMCLEDCWMKLCSRRALIAMAFKIHGHKCLSWQCSGVKRRISTEERQWIALTREIMNLLCPA